MEEGSLMSASTDCTHQGQEIPLVGKKKWKREDTGRGGAG